MLFEVVIRKGTMDNSEVINVFTVEADSHAQAFDSLCVDSTINTSHDGMSAIIKHVGYMMPCVVIPICFVG